MGNGQGRSSHRTQDKTGAVFQIPVLADDLKYGKYIWRSSFVNTQSI